MYRSLSLVGVRTVSCSIRRIRPWEVTRSHLAGHTAAVSLPDASWHSCLRRQRPQRQPQLMFLQFMSTARKESSSLSRDVSSTTTSSISAARKRKLRQVRKERRLRRQEAAVRDAIGIFKDVPRRSPQDFQNFFDAIMPLYSLSRMEELLDRIESKVKTAQTVPLPVVLQTTLQTANPSDDLQIHVLRYLLYNDQKPVTHQHRLPVDPGTVDTLLLAREKAVIHPLFWNKDDLRQTTLDADRILAPLQQHRAKIPEQIRIEATELGLRLRNHLPTKYYKNLVTLLEGYVGMVNLDAAPSTKTLEDVHEPERVGRPPIRLLGPALSEILSTHFFLVGRDLARFFYLDVPPETDADLTRSAEQWRTARDKFSTSLMDIQQEMVNVVEKFEAMYEQQAADQIAKKAAEKEEKAKQTKQKTKKKKIKHAKFQVIATEEELQKLNDTSSASCRIVFLDNLPIDVSNQEIRDLYSRCGAVKSVKIYNQRPDLDPGPLNQSQIQKRRRKQLKSVSNRPSRWQRPQTPVYGMVEFADEKGYRRAMDDTLRIFGMVIRRHPVRSLAAAELTTLFIEDLMDGAVGCLELEYVLEQSLGLQVSVAPGQDTKSLVGSCQISFPSFDVAWDSAPKLQELKLIQQRGGKVNWFRTPKDAEDWWTRERGFDY